MELRFRSALLELRFRIVEAPRLDPVAVRLTLSVPSLAEAAEALSDRSMRFDWERGLSYTDRRLSVIDPAGHRVALRQEWALL